MVTIGYQVGTIQLIQNHYLLTHLLSLLSLSNQSNQSNQGFSKYIFAPRFARKLISIPENYFLIFRWLLWLLGYSVPTVADLRYPMEGYRLLCHRHAILIRDLGKCLDLG